MDERKSKSSEMKNKKPKTAGSNVVSAEKRFASNRPFKEETPKKILNNNTDKAKKSAKEKETEEIERRRFLLDDEFFEEEKTDKPQKEKTPEKKGRVIGEINAKTGKKKKKKKKKKESANSQCGGVYRNSRGFDACFKLLYIKGKNNKYNR